MVALLSVGFFGLAGCESEVTSGTSLPLAVEGNPFDGRGRRLVPSPVPVLDVRVGAGEVERGVSHALVHGEGLVLTNVFTRQVLFLDGSGRVASRQGQDGFGPGEYITPRGLAILNGHPLVWDAFHRKIAFLGDPGAPPTEAVLSEETPRFFHGVLIGAFDDAVFLRFDPSGYQGGPTDPAEARQDVHFLLADARTGETLARWTLPGLEEWVARDQTNHGGLPIVFGRRAVAAVAHQRAYTADTDALILSVHGRDEPMRSVSLEPPPPQKVEADWVDQIRDSLRPRAVEESSGGRSPSEAEELLASFAAFRGYLLDAGLPARPTVPAFSDMLGSSDGELLWLRAYPLPPDTYVTWVGLDAALKPAFHVEVPVGVEVWDLTRRHLLTWTPDRAGRGQLRLYPLQEGLP